MIKQFCVLLFIALFSCGCSSHQQDSSSKYPRKPGKTDGRKAGAAMLLYEQAEADMDVNTNVLVTPPKQKDSAQTKIVSD